MQTLKDATEGIYPSFQMTPYQKVMAGGFKRGEMALYYSAGRQAGKSTLNQMYRKLWNDNLCKEIFLPMKPAPKYKFSRSKWYTAEYDWRDFDGVWKWCEEQFGPHPKNPDAWSRWRHSYADTIRFRDEKDYLLFVLRWT